MRNPNPLGAGEGRSAMTPVTSDCGFVCVLLVRFRAVRRQNFAGLLRAPGSRQSFRQGVCKALFSVWPSDSLNRAR
jgi:hypothetical protein